MRLKWLGLLLGLSCLWSFLKVVSSDILFFTFFPYHDDIHAHLNCLKSNHVNEYLMWAGLVNGEVPQGVSTYNVIFAFLLFQPKYPVVHKTPNRPSMEIMNWGLGASYSSYAYLRQKNQFHHQASSLHFLLPGGVLNKVLYLEAPSQGPTPYSFIYHFW